MSEGEMVELPKSIRVGWRDFTVERWQSNLAAGAGRYGECDKMNAIIRVDTKFGAAKAANTLLHEVLHAACDVGERDDDDREERTVCILSGQLTQIWRDNPEFVAFMSAALHPSS